MDAVTEEDRDPDGAPARVGQPSRDCQQVGDAGEGDRDGMQVDAGDVVGQPVQGLSERYPGGFGGRKVAAGAVE
nr:hypothetical protein [Salinispora arenicola]